MNRQICLITGATSGIGKAAAFALAKNNYELILIGRNEAKVKKVCCEIRKKTGNDHVNEFVCDLSMLQDVRRVADKVKNAYNRIDVMINNAGAKILRHQLTKDGIELTLATNHLGHFTLTLSLMGLLKRSQSARIINVSSGAHYASDGVIENILKADFYDGRRQYANSKLANVLFTYALADKLKGRSIGVNAVDPGGVATNFSRNNGLHHWIKHRLYYLKKRQLLTPEQGAATLVYLASANNVMGITGKYFNDLKETKSSDISYDKALQNKIWEFSARLSGIDIEVNV
jgi:NAD(P)-dependent dehydrogenase (short-subunit alcohol dehydrogenase family)